ncbi:MAG: type II toxin-antitoxin system VapC family toxin [Acidobacteriota bacterium]
MTYLLDTNTCIRYLNGTSETIRSRLEACNPEEVVLCSIVKAELVYGALKSGNPDKNLERLRNFTDRFASLPFDDGAAEVYGRVRARLERRGTPIGPNDLLIAAISLAHRMTLVTHNVDEFSRVEDLHYEDWE